MSRNQEMLRKLVAYVIGGVWAAILLSADPAQAFTPMYDSVDLTFTLIHDYNTNSVSDPYDDDNDDDGLADIWEIDLFGDLSTATAHSDYDGDGFTDVQEYLAGTDPKDQYSNLQIEFVRLNHDGSVTLWWESTDQMFPFPRAYDIQYATTLAGLAGQAPITVVTNVPSEGLSTAFSMQQPGAPSQQRFYRVILHQRE